MKGSNGYLRGQGTHSHLYTTEDERNSEKVKASTMSRGDPEGLRLAQGSITRAHGVLASPRLHRPLGNARADLHRHRAQRSETQSDLRSEILSLFSNGASHSAWEILGLELTLQSHSVESLCKVTLQSHSAKSLCKVTLQSYFFLFFS